MSMIGVSMISVERTAASTSSNASVMVWLRDSSKEVVSTDVAVKKAIPNTMASAVAA